MTEPLRIPATLATQKGAKYLAAQAADHTVLLTNHGKATAVVMSPDQFDEMARTLRTAADQLVSGLANIVAEQSTFRSVSSARERLHAGR